MLIRLLTYCIPSLLCILPATGSYAQLGAPIINQDFGLGNGDPNTIGTPLPAGKTAFPFSNSLCPPPGSYTIARRININGCYNGRWIPLSSDYTDDHIFGMDLGNMMMVNNDGVGYPRMIYTDTVKKPLCAGGKYEFSVAIINLDEPGGCSPAASFPYFSMVVEDGTGQVIAIDTINGVSYASPIPRYVFGKYTLDFILPAGVNSLVIKLFLLPIRIVANCGSDFAVDDITLSPVGPRATIAFDGAPDALVASACFQDNKTISLNGHMDPYYSSPLLQWQQSIDKGVTWTDIAGATSNAYSGTFSTPDTFLFRLSGGEAANISNTGCRVVSNVMTVNIDGLPTNFAVTSNSPVCSGNDLRFNASGGASYLWSGPNGFYDNVYYAGVYHAFLADSGTYYVDIFSLGGCRARDSIQVKIIGVDVFASPVDTSICSGRPLQLRASPGGVSYSWSPAAGLSNTNIINPVARPAASTVYSVKLTSKDGCTAVAKTNIAILNKVAVKAGLEGPVNLCLYYDSASFKDKSNGGILSWNWNFGNGQESLLQNPPVQYYTIGSNQTNFTVQLAVKDSTGCTDTAYQVLKVANNCFIAVPSAFTPNGDGENDYLYPLNAYKATRLTFRVYNRNGQLVFETREWTNKWDGTIHGNPQPAGAYVWILDYRDPSGKKVALKGTSVLIR